MWRTKLSNLTQCRSELANESSAMTAHLHHLLTQVFKLCLRTGRIMGVRRDKPLARAAFPMVSHLAIAWLGVCCGR